MPSTASTRWGTTLAMAAGTRVASALGKPPTRSAPRSSPELGELGVGQRQALGQGVGVLERERAGVGQRQPAVPAVQQPRPQLALERGDLLGHRGLGQRQLTRGGRERSGPRDGAEGEQPTRIQH